MVDDVLHVAGVRGDVDELVAVKSMDQIKAEIRCEMRAEHERTARIRREVRERLRWS